MDTNVKYLLAENEKIVLGLAALHAKLVDIRGDLYMADNKSALTKINEMIKPLEENYLDFLCKKS